MNILSIECSTDLCLLSLDVNGKISSRQVQGVRSHSENILTFVAELLETSGISHQDLSAVAVSAGPGSFTGVRLAASIAKTIAWVSDIPVISLSSLALNAREYLMDKDSIGTVCILRDAKMKEVYAAIYRLKDNCLIGVVDDCLIKLTDLAQFLDDNRIPADASISVQSDLSQVLLDEHAECLAQLSVSTPSVTAISLSAQALEQFEQGCSVPALDFDPVYLRGKGGWKTLKEQQASK